MKIEYKNKKVSPITFQELVSGDAFVSYLSQHPEPVVWLKCSTTAINLSNASVNNGFLPTDLVRKVKATVIIED